MKLHPTSRILKETASFLLFCCFFLTLSAAAMAQTTFTVNSDGDSSNQTAGDGNCDTGGSVNGDPECTLRAAIEEANSESV